MVAKKDHQLWVIANGISRSCYKPGLLVAPRAIILRGLNGACPGKFLILRDAFWYILKLDEYIAIM